MRAFERACPACYVASGGGGFPTCRTCDGIGRVMAPGAPRYGCATTLAERAPGDVVELGDGVRAKVLAQQPRHAPEATWIGIALARDPFDLDDVERFALDATPYPSTIGVRMFIPRLAGGGAGERSDLDEVDSLQRRARGAGALL